MDIVGWTGIFRADVHTVSSETRSTADVCGVPGFLQAYNRPFLRGDLWCIEHVMDSCQVSSKASCGSDGSVTLKSG